MNKKKAIKQTKKLVKAPVSAVNTKNVQFSIEIKEKNRLDVFKAAHKENIISKYGLKRRHVSNTDAIRFLLDAAKA